MTTTLTEALAASPWSGRPAPATPAAWITRAEEVGAILTLDAVERDRAGATPWAEVRLLKESGLTVLLGPVEHGGGGQEWTTALRAIRAVSAGDASIGQLLGYHLLWAWAVRLVGTDAQIAAVEELYTTGNLFFGGAVNPRDHDLAIQDLGGSLVFTGRKSFSTGARVSDLVVLEGALPGGDHVFAIVPTAQEGIVFAGDWDNLGQRLSESGGVSITGVEVGWDQAAGYVDQQFQPLVYNTLNLPLTQQIFTAIYLGIAEGALATAGAYTRERTRAWPYGSDPKDSATEAPYILQAYGELRSRLWAGQALAGAVDAELSGLLHAPRGELTAGERGQVAVRVAAAKQVANDVALETTNRIFELTGARATSNKVGLDIYWRNIRTHSLHDPVAHKKREVGEYELLGRLPEPSWYT
ncbi:MULTISPECIES: acyl-CoA dehydrogenase family protein [Micrococcaceae]|uniref:Acyl-CoA dehydrogenase probable dibenzothiophene desulfurization enzyme n=1 Tax=Arthrobacter rhombi TaxID=71253 RepID=A0A1R4EZ05_9MICC|nr:MULTISPECIES: acyl-CoA dehydrogenase family protein [Micrococcaceae]PCC24071.1 monooxygenase [Glutamicibacter sp. BW78]SJM48889.1 Acyl-CoA dehydrogenase; probable dibenzothiophene desulfurization enzyme [Arthrobacter rhombi]